ncbi:MAG: nuclear transport factor 2 family protein [Terrimicrobiaceae bacterium]
MTRIPKPALFLLGACALLSGCMTNPKTSNDEVQAYLDFLKERPGANLQGSAEREALARLKDYLSNLHEENIRKNTATTYAADAFLNDTLKTEIGAAAIEKYFLGTAGNADEIRVEFQDVARSGNEYYLRWVMDVKFKKFHRGKSFRTIGMTHARFNDQGLVILHQDYWDSTTGFFQHVPVLGTGIRYIKTLF